jgi:NADPH:quinone reductase-like Zn-dependent oxidoreductase
MKAIVYDKSALPDGLRYAEIEKPTPAEDEVLIRVHAASVNPLDYHLLRHSTIRRVVETLGRQKTSQPGRDVAGEVEGTGPRVTQFKPGDAVFGSAPGAFAEYACTKESRVAAKPVDISIEHAAALPVAGLTALQGLRDYGRLTEGQSVLINGAAGGIGTFAVQIAKHLGAKVTAVCSTGNIQMVRELGADGVIDYTVENYTNNGTRYDLIFDIAGNHSLAERRRALKPQATYVGAGMVALNLSVPGLIVNMATESVRKQFVSQKFLTFIAKMTQEDLSSLAELVRSGKVTPIIDRTYDLPQVPDAIRYLEQRHARGKVVITMN